MARTIGEVSLAAELWTVEVQQRFDSLFAVASRKSLSGWRLVPKQSAEVLVLDGSKPLVAQDEITAPCVVYVGGDASRQPLGRSSQGWAAHLDVDFTLSDLIDILDRSAVFLMDWRARHKPSVILTLSRALDELKQQGFDCVHRFQLRSWVALHGSANTAANMRVLALLSRGPIDAKSMSDHSGMDLSQLLALLSLPQVQTVLRCSIGSPQVAAAAPKLTKTQPATSATRQWVSKLTGWITRGGRS
ncbi:hypothetical protein KUF54_13165 [Comamonas sp. Y33R10-2]|uniref:hypothetical protein n=1 Tax=Comamonas sp. Y33R10-2 TaxID=2853257 RepID=UPI001C5C8E39|nr:hypothetical protein [Comamonas sp. Y33R10-2]QXZ08985.1 hypothetical protein KUF54_13165 [Comamonas sp. Y33R10-2]